MPTDAHKRCSRAIRFLRSNWIQNPEVALNEKLQTVGLSSDYLKYDPDLFEVFRRKLYRRLNKHYHELLDLLVPANFVWQVKIMWKLLRPRQRNKLIYEQIRKAITVPKLGKQFDVGKVGETVVGNKTPKQSKDIDFVYETFENLTPAKEIRIRRTLEILQRTEFTWERNPVEVLKEKLEAVGLNMDIFGENHILFNKLKYQLSRKFQIGRFHKLYIFLESVNQKDYQWQTYTIWKVLFDMKMGEERYRLLQATLQI